MTEVTEYQMEVIAAWLGNLGWVTALVIWSAHFIWKGLRKK